MVDWEKYMKYVPWVLIAILLFVGFTNMQKKQTAVMQHAMLSPVTPQEAIVLDAAVQQADDAVTSDAPIVEPTVASETTTTMGLTSGAGSGIVSPPVEMTAEHFTQGVDSDAVFPPEYVQYPRAIAHYLVRNWPMDQAQKIFYRRFGRAITKQDLSGPLTFNEKRNMAVTRENSAVDVLGYPSWKIYTKRQYPSQWVLPNGKPQLNYEDYTTYPNTC